MAADSSQLSPNLGSVRGRRELPQPRYSPTQGWSDRKIQKNLSALPHFGLFLKGHPNISGPHSIGQGLYDNIPAQLLYPPNSAFLLPSLTFVVPESRPIKASCRQVSEPSSWEASRRQQWETEIRIQGLCSNPNPGERRRKGTSKSPPRLLAVGKPETHAEPGCVALHPNVPFGPGGGFPCPRPIIYQDLDTLSHLTSFLSGSAFRRGFNELSHTKGKLIMYYCLGLKISSCSL